MIILLALGGYVVLLVRLPIDRRLKQRHAGWMTIVVGLVALIGLWIIQSDKADVARFVGELVGVCAVYLMTVALVLAARLRRLERWFGGLDRMYQWHKIVAVAAVAILVPHAVVSGASALSQPNAVGGLLGIVALVGLLALVAVSVPRVSRVLRLPYPWWLLLHRFIGLLLIAGVVHGLLVGVYSFAEPVLGFVYLGIGVVGVLVYAYDEVVMRRRFPRADFVVHAVARPSDDVLDVVLRPTGDALDLRPGQFVFVRVGGEAGWHQHPFSVAGAAAGGDIRLTIRAAGVETSGMYDEIREGLPAVVAGPYGRFDHTVGGDRQIWVAGGIGIAPFLSWVHTIEPTDDRRIDLFYSVPTAADAVFLDELTTAARRLPRLTVHPVFTRDDGHLTADRMVAGVGSVEGAHVFLCGPAAMVADLSAGLRHQGLDRHHIHWEHFAFR